MRSRLRQIALLLSLVLSASFTPALGEKPGPDTVYGITRERFREFESIYSVTEIHYSAQFVLNRLVGNLGEVEPGGSLVNAVMGFLETNRDVFKLHDVQSQLVLDTIETGDDGSRTVVLQQMHRGLKVAGCHVDFGISPDGSIGLMIGRYFPDITVPEKPKIDSAAAIGVVRDSLAKSANAASRLDCTLCILPVKESFLLVWQVNLPQPAEAARRVEPIYVDAISGAIVPG